jgi:polysaccharide pyruvyl transferase WcaK-like protein
MQRYQLVDGVDPAFHLPPAKEADIDRALAELGIAPDDRFLAVNLRSGPVAMDAVAQAAGSALKAKMIDYLLLFGMQRYWRETDDDVLRRFAKIAEDLPMRSAPTWSAALLKGALSRARAVIACRYHAVVFALTSGVPSLSLAVSKEYSWKLHGAYHQFRRPEWLTRPDLLEHELLHVLRRREAFSTHLLLRRAELSATTSPLVETVKEVIQERCYAA